jgi:hypothetical protein
MGTERCNWEYHISLLRSTNAGELLNEALATR